MPDKMPEVEIELDHPKLNVFQTSMILLSSIGGSGLFIAMSTITMSTGSVGLTILMFLVSGLLNYSLARCFTEVAIQIPKAGGPYFFIYGLFGKLPAFLFLWGFILMIVTPVWAVMAYTASLNFVQIFFPSCQPPESVTKLLAVTLLVVTVGVNCLYFDYVTKFQALLSSMKILAIIMIIIGAFVVIAKAPKDVDTYDDVFEGSGTDPGQLALGLLAGMFIYGGWQLITFLLEQMDRPEKNLPKALGISFFIIISLNVLTVASFFVLISAREMKTADAVAVLYMERLYSPFTPIISIFVMVVCIGTLNSAVLAHSRLLVAAAGRSHMPQAFRMISEKYKMPWPATLFLCTVSILVILSSSLAIMIETTSFYAVIMSLAVLLCLFTLRIKKTAPQVSSSLKVWLGTAIFQFVLNFAILALCVYHKPAEFGRLILMLAAGLPVYVVCVQWRPKVLLTAMDSLTIFLQKLLVLKKG